MPGQVKYPNIRVKIVGENGNAFNLIGIVRRALLDKGVPRAEVLEFQNEAMSGDYDHVLNTITSWVKVR